MIIVEFLEWLNPTLWVIVNLALIYIGVLLLAFTILYPTLFEPSATTGGKMIFRFALSSSMVVALIVVGIFIDPSHDIPWYEYSGDTIWWRPIVRLGAYLYVAYTITSLVTFLWKRKFYPQKLKRAPDKELVKPRHDTSEIPTIKKKKND